METTTFKCPNCAGSLALSPETQKLTCEQCGSAFDEQTLLNMSKEADSAKREDGAEAVYNCPSCGAQLVTAETTAATMCYYCHSPVVLAGRLQDDMRPDKVLPFAISKDEAIKKFMKWVKKKRFVPKDYFSAQQLEYFTGVYYPYWSCDMAGACAFEGEGTTTSRVETARNTTIVTKHYRVVRRGNVTFKDVMRPALQPGDRKLSDGIHPFDQGKCKDFSAGYLSGFQAEKRDVESETVRPDVEQELKGYVKPLLTRGCPYETLTGTSDARFDKRAFEYHLLPVWALTYKGKDGETYAYAMNGQTGAVCGKLPLSKSRLVKFCALWGAAVFAALLLGGYFLW